MTEDVISRLDAAAVEIASISVDLRRAAERASRGAAARLATDRAAVAAGARRLLHDRAERARFFDPKLFGEPSWDMLLTLAAARASVSVTALAALAAPTTGLRRLADLLGAGLIERVPDPADRRRHWVSLSAAGRAAIANYLAARATPSPTLRLSIDTTGYPPVVRAHTAIEQHT